jgi:acetyl esterase/lipase
MSTTIQFQRWRVMIDLTADPVLEQSVQHFVDLAATPPFFHELNPNEARRDLEFLQSAADEGAVTTQLVSVLLRDRTTVTLRLVLPLGTTRPLPIVLFIHGGAWVLGSGRTHHRLVRDIAVGAAVAVAFPEYDRAPEAKYPTALEQCWAVAEWLTLHGGELGLDSRTVLIAGDCVGGNLAAAVALLANRRPGVSFAAQILLYPAVDTEFDSPSYVKFAEGFYTRRDSMIWGFGQYAEREQWDDVRIAPLHATIAELRHLPPALIVTAEADVVRDEGEAYAARLREAGVEVTSVRYAGTIHHFMMLDALRDSDASKAALAQTIAYISDALPRREDHCLARALPVTAGQPREIGLTKERES